MRTGVRITRTAGDAQDRAMRASLSPIDLWLFSMPSVTVFENGERIGNTVKWTFKCKSDRNEVGVSPFLTKHSERRFYSEPLLHAEHRIDR
jgi:hypothetical protein